jgi:hypothetical protein
MKTYVSAKLTGYDLREKSYIPEINGDVMYTALGLVDSLNLHCLFDRKMDTVIQFPRESRLTRNKEKNNLMDLVMPIVHNTEIRLMPEYYTKVLGMPSYIYIDFFDKYFPTAPAGWNSWLCFFRDVTEDDVVKITDWVAENLREYGAKIIHLDDGYELPEHRCYCLNWNKNKFPHEGQWLIQYIRNKGLIPGLWLVPQEYGCGIFEHPEWYLRTEWGNPVYGYQGSPVVDLSSPKVIDEYWIPLFKTFEEWGVGYYKFDIGETQRVLDEYQSQYYDTSMTPYDVLVRAMKAFRDTVAPDHWLMEHPSNWGAHLGFLNAARCGDDTGADLIGMQNFLEVIYNNAYQNHILWWTNPDSICIRPPISFEEARTMATVAALTGVQFMSGDDLTELSEDRVELLRKCLPTTPIFPIDLFGRGRVAKRSYEEVPDFATVSSYFAEIIDLKVNAASGIYDVISVSNWGDKDKTRTIFFEDDLGLNSKYRYLVFDFWNQKLEGVSKDKFTTPQIKPRGTHVFVIRRVLDRPQLLATSRHITSAVSIEKLSWDSSELTLKGKSKTIPGEIYTLFVYVPKGFILSDVSVNAEGLSTKMDNDVLQVSFVGKEEPIDWLVKFRSFC